MAFPSIPKAAGAWATSGRVLRDAVNASKSGYQNTLPNGDEVHLDEHGDAFIRRPDGTTYDPDYSPQD